MELYWKAIAAVFTSLILNVYLGKQEKDFASLITMAVCCLVGAAVLSFLQPVIDLLREMEAIAQLENGILQIILKCTGIALVTELSSLVCQDAGCSSMAKAAQLLGSTVILYLSIPVISLLLNLIRDILGVL